MPAGRQGHVTMYELSVERTFAAAHHLMGYDGPCARLHGHNYRVQIGVAGSKLDEHGMLMDFGQLKSVCDEVIGELDHTDLNQHPAFADSNPSSENLARHIFARVAERLKRRGVCVSAVTVWESDTSQVTYTEG